MMRHANLNARNAESGSRCRCPGVAAATAESISSLAKATIESSYYHDDSYQHKCDRFATTVAVTLHMTFH